FVPDFYDLPLLPVSPYYLLIRHIVWRHCTCSIWCFFFPWESACDQHKANQHCRDRGQGCCTLLEQNENSSYKL
ncbi:unnamed protein product, partial [Staurois parvus]